MRDFLNIMETQNYFRDDQWNKTDSVYTFERWKDSSGKLHGGCIMEFFGVESWEKVKGARRDVLFVNEANHISYNAYTQMEVRTKEIIWLDWNPESEFWWYAGEEGELSVKDRANVDSVVLTYLDNEALDKNIIEAIEARQGNKNWWRVYGLGLLGEVEGRIYKEWEFIDEIPHEASLRRYGLDFGYTNDPTAIVAVYYYNGGWILDEIAYRYGLNNREIADILTAQPHALVVADSAEPKSIDEIKKYQVNITAAQKGAGSVLQGIQYVQGQRVSVTKASVNLIKEYRNYLWMTDKEGKIINEPQEFLNHAMDAVRYGMDPFKPAPFKMNTEVGGVKPFFDGMPG